MTSIKFYQAEKIFTGDHWISDHVIVTENGLIKDISPFTSLNSSSEPASFPGCFIAPAFMDLQIYGAHERLFAVYPDVDALEKLRSYCAAGGAAFCLPTVATNTVDVFKRCIDAIREYWKNNGQGIFGLHIEGPWINKIKRGAHIESFIHSPSGQEVRELLDYGKGVIKMITLAPEICSEAIIRSIIDDGVIVSAGHSNATYRQAMLGFDWGIRTATHLYNAMSSLQHREPGLVGAIFNNENVRCSIIADGYHVDYEAIRIARKVMNGRLFAITDAVTDTHEGYYQHYRAGDKYEAAGILSGSALNMVHAFRNLVQHAGFEIEEALNLCSLNPAKVIGREADLGKIEPGKKAKMVVIDKNLELVSLIDEM